MENTYKSQTGNKVEVSGNQVTITTAAGKVVKLPLQKTTPANIGGGNRAIANCAFTAPVADWLDAHYAEYVQSKEDALEAAIPGIHEIMALDTAAYNERARYRRDFNRMMDDEDNDGARPPKAENKTAGDKLDVLLSSNPRAALYLKAKAQDESAHWPDNTGKGAAGKKAMEILTAGGSIEDATAALAARRECVD